MASASSGVGCAPGSHTGTNSFPISFRGQPGTHPPTTIDNLIKEAVPTPGIGSRLLLKCPAASLQDVGGKRCPFRVSEKGGHYDSNDNDKNRLVPILVLNLSGGTQ